VFLTARFVVARDAYHVRALLGDERLDLRQTVILDRQPEPRPDGADAHEAPPGSAAVTHYRDELIEVHTAAEGAAVLVLADNDFPGWRAEVDGRPAPLLQAYGGLRAVALPAGDHVVRFEYRPDSIRIGGPVSLAAAVIVAALFVYDGRARRPRAQPRTA
jgi:hypothetical protein